MIAPRVSRLGEETMLIDPAGITVDYGNGQKTTLKNEETWKKILAYIDGLFLWHKSYPGDPILAEGEDSAEYTQETKEAARPETISEKRRLPANSHMIDYMIIALGDGGGRGSAKNLALQIKDDGYKDTSISPSSNVSSKVRKYQNLVTHESKGNIALLPAGWKRYESLKLTLVDDAGIAEKNTVSEKTTDRKSRASLRSSGLVGIDYLLIALYQKGGSGKYTELVQLMLDAGWKPESATWDKKIHNVASIAHTGGEYVNRENGRAAINAKGLQRLENRAIEAGLTLNDLTHAKSYQQNSPAPDLFESNTRQSETT